MFAGLDDVNIEYEDEIYVQYCTEHISCVWVEEYNSIVSNCQAYLLKPSISSTVVKMSRSEHFPVLSPP